jgi:hypothetical protein
VHQSKHTSHSCHTPSFLSSTQHSFIQQQQRKTTTFFTMFSLSTTTFFFIQFTQQAATTVATPGGVVDAAVDFGAPTHAGVVGSATALGTFSVCVLFFVAPLGVRLLL